MWELRNLSWIYGPVQIYPLVLNVFWWREKSLWEIMLMSLNLRGNTLKILLSLTYTETTLCKMQPLRVIEKFPKLHFISLFEYLILSCKVYYNFACNFAFTYVLSSWKGRDNFIKPMFTWQQNEISKVDVQLTRFVVCPDLLFCFYFHVKFTLTIGTMSWIV